MIDIYCDGCGCIKKENDVEWLIDEGISLCYLCVVDFTSNWDYGDE